jgi:hypothetical protein
MSWTNSRGVLLQGSVPRLGRALCRVLRIVVPKSLYVIKDDLPVARRTARVNPAAVCVFLGFVVFPFLIESLSLWVAQWFNVMNKPLAVQTPLLDWASAKVLLCWGEFGRWAAWQFEEANASPRSILLIAAVLLVIAARLLKK